MSSRDPQRALRSIVPSPTPQAGTERLGWSWAECIKPIVGTDTCQLKHVGIAQSGAMHVEHEDGTEQEIKAGDVYVIEPGHNARGAGDEPFVGYEFESASAETYATVD